MTFPQILLSLTCLTVCFSSALAAPTAVPQIGHSAPINHLAYSPSGRFLSSASEDTSVRIWAEDGNVVAVLDAHQAPVVQSAFVNDRYLLSIDRIGVLLAWNTLSESQTTVADFDGILSMTGKDVLGLAQNNSHLAVAGHRSFHWAKLATDWQPGTAVKFDEVRVGFDIDAIAISPSGRYIAAVNKIGDVFIYDTQDKRKLFREMLDPVFTRAGFINEQFLALAGRGISLFHIEQKRIVNTIANTGRFATVQAMAISPADGAVATITEKLQVFDAETKRPVADVEGVAETAVAFTPDGSRIAVVDDSSAKCSADGTRIRILDSEGNERSRFAGGIDAAPKAALSGDRLAINACSSQVQFWNLPSRKLQHSITGLESVASALSFDADGEKLYILTNDGRLLSWHKQTSGGELEEIKSGLNPHLTDLSPSTNQLAYAKQNSDDLTQVHLESIDDSSESQVLSKSFSSDVEQIQFSPRANKLTVRTDNDAIVVFNLSEESADSAANRGRIGLDGSRIVDYAFNPASEQVVVAYDTRLELWSSKSFSKINMTSAKYPGVSKLRFSEDGTRFALLTARTLVLYNAADLSVIHEIHGVMAADAYFTDNDNTLLAINRDARVDIYDIKESPKKVATIQNINDKYGYALGADDQMLSTASDAVTQPLLLKTVQDDKIKLELVAPKKKNKKGADKSSDK